MRSRHYTVLVAAAGAAGRSQRDLGELLGIDPSAVVAIVDDLERDGLVRREPAPEDRRTRLIVSTDAGRARVAESRVLAETVDDHLLATLDAEERAQLLSLVRRITTE